MGQNIVKGERMGLSPLAVSELTKEFRRLAAEARSGASRTQSDYRRAVNSSRAQTFEQAAQMLEEKLP